jgi:hypothetical protein
MLGKEKKARKWWGGAEEVCEEEWTNNHAK